MIEDLRSTNGTFVNRQRISGPYQLSNGDLIGLGETVTLVYEAGMPVAADTMPAAAPLRREAMPPPPAPMYDEEEEEEETAFERNRWIVIGCAVLTVLFCCTIVVAGIVIDSYNLWCDLPIIPGQ